MNEENNYKTLLDKGIDKFYQADFNDAINYLNESIKLKNDFEVSYFYRGACLQAIEKFDDAILDYTKAISLNPKMTDAYYNRAKIIIEKPNSKEKELNFALNDLKTALKQDENFKDALFAIACTEKKLKNYTSSLEYLEKLLVLSPDNVHARALKKLILMKYIK